MSLIDALLVQILAHLLGDFYCQTEERCRRKTFCEMDSTWPCILANLRHGLVIWIFSFLSFVFLGLVQTGNSAFYAAAVAGSLFCAGSHVLIDLVKSKAILRGLTRDSTETKLFFKDQITHMIAIGLLIYWLEGCAEVGWYIAISDITRWLAFASAFFFVCKPSNIIIKHVLDGFKIEPGKENHTKKQEPIENQSAVLNAGRLIGACERILLLLLLVKGLFTEAGLILGAKSILRYENAGKNEYVLVGTLLSVTVVAVVYVALELAGFVSP
ncbi:MAG: DUF3307 domain-containing protein [Kiritimatiellia bacterium]